MTTREADRLEQVIVAELPGWIAAHPTLRAQLQNALMGSTPGAPPHMTYEEFLVWADEDTLAEWVALPDTDEGEVIMTSPASTRHQLLGDFLLKVLGTYVEVHDLGVALSAPFQMKLAYSGREPDLLFVATAHMDRLKDTYLDGPADLVVEIASPESLERDRGAKFVEYARGGAPEYWLIDPQAQWAEFYRLGEMEQYETALAGRQGRYEAQTIPGFWLQVEWMWRSPLPPVEDVLLEVGGDAYAQRWVMRLRERGYLD